MCTLIRLLLGGIALRLVSVLGDWLIDALIDVLGGQLDDFRLLYVFELHRDVEKGCDFALWVRNSLDIKALLQRGLHDAAKLFGTLDDEAVQQVLPQPPLIVAIVVLLLQL